MEGLAVAIQSGKVSYPDGPIVSELKSFEYSYTQRGVRYQAREGTHDDCVCALALAVEEFTRPLNPFNALAAERIAERAASESV